METKWEDVIISGVCWKNAGLGSAGRRTLLKIDKLLPVCYLMPGVQYCRKEDRKVFGLCRGLLNSGAPIYIYMEIMCPKIHR